MTGLICGKYKEVKKGFKIKDKAQYPLYLTLAEYKLKIHMSLNPQGDMFDLYVNQVDFLSLPYKYDLVPDGDPSVTLNANVYFN